MTLKTEHGNLKIVDFDGSVLEKCGLAKHLSDAGDYEAARSVMADYWVELGVRPNISSLGQQARAEVLLRVGYLTSFIGGDKQIQGAQEAAKDLLSEAARLFEELGAVDKVVECENYLALCHWRLGASDEARILLKEAILNIGDHRNEQRLNALVNLAMVEYLDGNHEVTRDLLLENAIYFDEADNHALVARFHNNLALAFKKSNDSDRALIEFTACAYHLELAGNTRYLAHLESNLGGLFLSIGKYKEAHEHLNKSLKSFEVLRDKDAIAATKETSARVYLEEKEYMLAEEAVIQAITIYEQSGEFGRLVEALLTLANIQSRRDETHAAFSTFARAHQLALQFISADRATEVICAMSNELSARCLYQVGVTFDAAVHKLEAELIKTALRNHNADPKPAALKLGLKPDTLRWMLNTRHHDLLAERKPISKRHRSIIQRARANVSNITRKGD